MSTTNTTPCTCGCDPNNPNDPCKCPPLHFLNILRNNRETLRMVNRADSATSPYYWPIGRLTEFTDGTFGVRGTTRFTPTSTNPILRLRFTLPPSPAFHLIDMGGSLTVTREGFRNDRIYSANIGSLEYDIDSSILNYRVRAFGDSVQADIWVRYATRESAEI